MSRSTARLARRLLPVLALAAMPVFGCASLRATPTRAALGYQAPSTLDTVTVAGCAVVSVEPDLAQISLGTEGHSEHVAGAVRQSEAAMASVLASLKALEVASSDVEVGNCEYSTGEAGGTAMAGFRAYHKIVIVTRDLQRVGELIDTLFEAGATRLWEVRFTLADPQALEDAARAEAVEDARQEAKALAELAGLRLGRVLAVSQGEVAGPRVVQWHMEGWRAVTPDTALVRPGRVQLSYQVSVTYAVEPQ